MDRSVVATRGHPSYEGVANRIPQEACPARQKKEQVSEFEAAHKRQRAIDVCQAQPDSTKQQIENAGSQQVDDLFVHSPAYSTNTSQASCDHEKMLEIFRVQ